MIKAVSFDGDDTLWSFTGISRDAIRLTLEFLEKITGSPSPLSVEEVIAIRDAIELDEGPIGLNITVEDIRRKSFHQVAGIAGLDPQKDGNTLTDYYFEVVREVGKLFPEAEPVLAELSKRFKVGEITNGNSTPARFGSDAQLDFIVIAQDIGLFKPGPEIFEFAANLAGCNITEMMHVGDSLTNDVQGANSVGAVSVWLNANGVENESDIQPDHEIRSLSEIPAILDGY
ncbi:MAG: HAD family hydrolase [Chloroflexi bacterium]|nr:HAD family hydrolase [Chloroflexota bacterium]